MFFFCFVLIAQSSGRYGKTPNAFIFSLNNFERLAPFVSYVKKDKTERAIDRSSYYGPKFGDDLVICLDAENIQDSKADLGAHFSVPDAVKNQHTVLDGHSATFSLDEVEVFYLDPSR